MKKRGRPTKLTPQVRERILNELRDGKLLHEVCQAAGIDRVTVYSWMRVDAEFCAAVRRAREDGSDALAEAALSIADAADPVPGVIAKARLRADVRLKLAAAWNPTYSNRPQVQVTHEPPRIDFGLSPEKMVYLVRAVEAALGSDVIDVTPLRLAASLQRTKGRLGR